MRRERMMNLDYDLLDNRPDISNDPNFCRLVIVKFLPLDVDLEPLDSALGCPFG
jgi:hypothetical protein